VSSRAAAGSQAGAVGVTSVSGHDVLNVERVPSVDQTSAAPFLPADPTDFGQIVER
jgi:hypothetical protein